MTYGAEFVSIRPVCLPPKQIVLCAKTTICSVDLRNIVQFYLFHVSLVKLVYVYALLSFFNTVTYIVFLIEG